MSEFFPHLPALGLFFVLLTMIWTDVRHRRLPNRLVLLVALLACCNWLLLPERSWVNALARIGLMAGAFGLFSIPFLMGWMGGGDVKLFSALGLWCSPERYYELLLIASLCGLVLSLYALAQRYFFPANDRARLQVPYGVAICVAAIWVICQPVINHLSA